MSILILNIPRLLDESSAGKSASAHLNERLSALRDENEKLPEAEQAAFGAQAVAVLEQEREKLREEVISLARPFAGVLMLARKAQAVLHAAAVVAYDEECDITDEILAKMG